MKPIAVLYATREGQTRRIGERVAGDLPPVRCRMQGPPEGYRCDLSNRLCRRSSCGLYQLPTAFLSVTLSEAGAEMSETDPEKHARFSADVRKVMDRFFEATGWRPRRVMPVAGALLYSKYNPLVRFIMKRIARQVGASTDTSHDYEYTDWVGLDHFVDELADQLPASAPRAGR
jgi:menaquinone-dependent protoporphyrinogen IX oxidase